MKRRWLIISYFVNIDALAPSHHIDDRLPFFKKRGIDVHLLSSPCGAKYHSLLHTRILSLAPSGIRYEVRHLLRRRIKSKTWFKFWETILLLPVYPFYFVEKALLRLDSTWSWFITATVAATVLSLRKKPEIIYSTGGPVSAHIAAMAASLFFKVPHIAEFQDPLVHKYAAPGKTERLFIKGVERLVLRYAVSAVFLTKQAAKNASARNPQAKSIKAIYAGSVSREDNIPYEKTKRFDISHFGSLGGSRNPDYFFKALKLLFHNHPDLKDSFRLNLYGNNSREVSRHIENFLYKIVNVNGKVKRHEAIESMFRADVLLLLQNTDDVSFETIPSKVYEYFHTGRPILALVYRNMELQAMLEEMGHIVVQADDESAIERGLETYMERWRQNQLQSFSVKSPYTVERAVDELISLANVLENAKKR